jgi:uncharacterized protein
MIVEGLVTSVAPGGQLNVAPMGPIVCGDFDSLLLRPFQPSMTFDNLAATRCGVFHIVDQVDVIARAAIGRLVAPPPVEPATAVTGAVLQDCCRWFEFSVDDVDTSEPRSRMSCTVLYRGERRPFFGFNRARHAVLEAAILATRVHLLPASQIRAGLDFLRPAVEKTGGATELSLWNMLEDYIAAQPGCAE